MKEPPRQSDINLLDPGFKKSLTSGDLKSSNIIPMRESLNPKDPKKDKNDCIPNEERDQVRL